jgi:hypothetical protein
VSSSSFDDRPARRLLGAAFTLLHEEAPLHAHMLCHALGGVSVRIDAGDESFAPRLCDGKLGVTDACGAESVAIRTSLATVLGLLDAHGTLLDAVARGALDVRGTADALDAAADAFATFLHGMVRAPSSPALLDDLRREVRCSGDLQ